MITPAYALTATERVLPSMAMDFTTALLDSRVTFSRSGNTATVTNSSGVIVGINANLPRFDFNPTTLVCRGLLIEEARTNALLNSLIDGTSLETQLVTVTAAARTLSFYGTGTIELSGAHSATVIGAGAYPTRTILTFTPSAGVLTLTVTGTVQFAQLEIGGFATSYIPTEATAVTRNADVATITGTNFSSWYNASEGTFAVKFNTPSTTPNAFEARAAAGNTDFIRLSRSNTRGYVRIFSSSSEQAGMLPDYGGSWLTGVTVVGAYKVNNFVSSAGGVNISTDASGAVPVNVTNANLGTSASGGNINGHLQQLRYWPMRLTNNEVQSIAKG